MGKYTRLTQHLADQDAHEFTMTFAEISSILGSLLPKAASTADWWACRDPDRRAQRKALSAAGFRATLADVSRVKFARTATARRDLEGYGKLVYRRDGSTRMRYHAIDPAERADKCTCGKPTCVRNRLLPFREHVAALYRTLRDCMFDAAAEDWESVAFALLMAASISDVEADTGYVEDPMVFALCEPTIDYENARSEMASKYVAAASIFNFLWNAYEAAIAATRPNELRGLLKEGRLGERGRRMLESRPELSNCFIGIDELTRVAIHWSRRGAGLEHRLDKIDGRALYGLALAAELCREFRNFLFHGEDEVPDHPDWGDVTATGRLCRFYSMGRLLLYLVQTFAYISLAETEAIDRSHDGDGDLAMYPRNILANVQFREPS